MVEVAEVAMLSLVTLPLAVAVAAMASLALLANLLAYLSKAAQVGRLMEMLSLHRHIWEQEAGLGTHLKVTFYINRMLLTSSTYRGRRSKFYHGPCNSPCTCR